MKNISNIFKNLLASITFGVGLLLEYKFSIVQKVKSYLVSVWIHVIPNDNNVPVDELKVIISDSALSDIKTQRQNAMDDVESRFSICTFAKFFTEMILWMLSLIERSRHSL